MSSPMTLREAVEIVECGRFDYSHPRGPDYDPSDARAAVWDRARAIVDAAVEAHEKRCAWVDTFPDECAEALKLRSESKSAYDKLRALERGESEVQP